MNFSFFVKKGKSLIDDDEYLNMNANLSCVVRRFVGALANEELDQRRIYFMLGAKSKIKCVP